MGLEVRDDHTAHTHGPWFVNGNVIRGDARSRCSVSVACILDVAYPYGRRAGESAQANARLIAAAQALLQALREMTERIEDHPAYQALTEEEENLTGGDTAELSYLARVGRAAIAKATERAHGIGGEVLIKKKS